MKERRDKKHEGRKTGGGEEESNLVGIFFHLTASHYFRNVLISNISPKSPLRLGILESTQKQGLFLQLIDYQALQKQSDGYGVENTAAHKRTTNNGP